MPFWSRFDPVRLLPFGFILPLAFLVVLALWHRQYLERRHDDLTRVATEAATASSRQMLLLERAARLADDLATSPSPDSTRTALLDALREMEAHHWQVAHGDPTFGLDVPSPTGVLDVYFAAPDGIDDRMHELFERGHALLAEDPPTGADLAAFRGVVGSPLPAGLENVGRAYSEWVDTEFSRLSRYERNAFLTALGALLLLVPGLFLSSRWLITLLTESNRALAAGLRTQAHESRAHQAAKDSEIRRRRLREESILASLAEGVLVCDGDGRFLLASPRAEEFLGRPGEADPLLPWTESLTLFEEDGETPARGGDMPIFQALRGEEPDLRVMLHRRAGEPERWLSMSARPLVRHDRTEGAVMLIRDISGRKQASDEIAAAERRLRFLVDQLPAVLWTTDRDMRLTSSRGRGLKALGLRPDEVVGMTLFELFGTRDENFVPIAAQRRACNGESLVYDFDWRGLRFESHVEPLGENGNREGAIGIALDVTEARHATEEFRVARRIQQQLFPRRHPALPGLHIAGATYPANSAAGDYYDYLPLGERSIGLVVGDVSGHGVGPAMIMAETRAYLRALSLMHEDVGGALERLNDFLLDDIVAERFVTLILVEIDPQARTLRYASAGHSAAYVLAPDGSRKATLEATGVPLGLFAGTRYPLSGAVPLEEGDLVVIPTDGILEAENRDEEEFGIDGMLATAHRHRHESPARIVRRLHEAVRAHCGDGPQQDDITAIVVKVT